MPKRLLVDGATSREQPASDWAVSWSLKSTFVGYPTAKVISRSEGRLRYLELPIVGSILLSAAAVAYVGVAAGSYYYLPVSMTFFLPDLVILLVVASFGGAPLVALFYSALSVRLVTITSDGVTIRKVLGGKAAHATRRDRPCCFAVYRSTTPDMPWQVAACISVGCHEVVLLEALGPALLLERLEREPVLRDWFDGAPVRTIWLKGERRFGTVRKGQTAPSPTAFEQATPTSFDALLDRPELFAVDDPEDNHARLVTLLSPGGTSTQAPADREQLEEAIGAHVSLVRHRLRGSDAPIAYVEIPFLRLVGLTAAVLFGAWGLAYFGFYKLLSPNATRGYGWIDYVGLGLAAVVFATTTAIVAILLGMEFRSLRRIEIWSDSARAWRGRPHVKPEPIPRERVVCLIIRTRRPSQLMRDDDEVSEAQQALLDRLEERSGDAIAIVRVGNEHVAVARASDTEFLRSKLAALPPLDGWFAEVQEHVVWI